MAFWMWRNAGDSAVRKVTDGNAIYAIRYDPAKKAKGDLRFS
jgi:hypothetical protein